MSAYQYFSIHSSGFLLFRYATVNFPGESQISRNRFQAKNGFISLYFTFRGRLNIGLSVLVGSNISSALYFFPDPRITMTDKTAAQLSLITFVILAAITDVLAFVSSSSQIDSSTTTVNHGPWAEVLETWVTTFNNSRAARAMKVGDKTVTVSTKISTTNKRDVSETDLYLLNAIEKLVYRIDHLEKRIRRAEELLYYVIDGNNKMKEPCPANYTRMGKNCYHFSNRDFNWKSSASLCRGMGGHLVEFDTIEESQDIIAGVLSDSNLRGKNFWTGGLNPGLLWIWATSARPVYQDTKQPVIGDGRCLKLTFNPSSKIYSYRGEDCGLRQRYICELTVDDESANRIEKTARLLIDKDN